MKRWSLMIVLLLAMVSLTAYAGNGAQNHGKAKNNACSNVLGGTSATIKGVVMSIGNHDGLVVDTGSNQVTVYGIGPEWYWEDKGIDRPEIGDLVKVEAYAVVFSDGTRYIASSIILGDETLFLRDAETGCPLWRGPRKH